MIGNGKMYFGQLSAALMGLDLQLDHLRDQLVWARTRGAAVWICGNGGSFSVAQHWACDFSRVALRAFVLGSNGAVSSAWANDVSYAEALGREFGRSSRGEDLLVALSCSGTSPNIVHVLERARARRCPTVLVTSTVNREDQIAQAQYTIRVPSDDYGVIEDCFAAIGHYLTKELANT